MSKIKNYDMRCASPCQMSSNSVKSLSRHLDFCDFKKDGRRHLGFSKIQNWGILGSPTMTARWSTVAQNLVEIDAVVSII